MARIELPIRAFLEDRAKQAFPDRNWSRGSAISDLVLKSMAVLMQPISHEIDCIKINQSIANFQFMRRSDLDALAANWGKFRQTGSRSLGNVRMYFDTASNYRFTYLEFTSRDGTSFTLVAPVTITSRDLLSNRLQDGTYYFDVAVQSTGIGNRYALPAGSIVSISNAPSGVVRVENIEDFKVTAPDETNYDVVNSMFKNLGMRNLVSPSSIRAPLLDQFAGVLDIFIAGADHVKMVRDLVTAKISGLDTQIHVGGMTDIWVNTTSVVQREVVLSYLPSSGRARIVSSTQAAENEVLYTFGRSLVDIDGLYSSPDYPSVLLDESTGVMLSVAGLLNDTRVLGLSARSRYQLSALDILLGTEMLAVPTKNNLLVNSPLLTDISGLDFSSTPLLVGDMLEYANSIQKVTRKSGRLVEVGPSVSDQGFILWDSVRDTLTINPGDRFIPFTNSGVCDINHRCVIPGGAAAGLYRVLAVTDSGFSVGNVVASGSIAYQSYNSTSGQYTYQYTGNLPYDVGSTCSIYLGTDNGYDQTDSKWLRIVSVTRAESGVTIVTKNGTSTPPGTVKIIQCLRDRILDKTPIWFEEHAAANFPRATRQSFGDEGSNAVSDIGHTLYVNDTEAEIAAGTITLSAIGLGRTATVGNLVLFDGTATIDDADLHSTQGDGTKFTVVVDSIVNEDSITFRPALPFAIPPATRYALMRNNKSLATVTVVNTNLSEKTIKLGSWPMGLGDGVGYILKHSSGLYAVQYSTAGVLRTLSFQPPRKAIDVTLSANGYITTNPSDLGKSVVQSMAGGGTAVGILKAFDNSTRVWSIVPNDVSVDLFTTSNSRPFTIQNSPAVGYATAITSPYDTGYFDPNSGDIGGIVRQGTYSGILQSFNSSDHTWAVKPLSEYDVFDNTDPDVVTFIDYGNGRPASNLGYGTVFQPATSPQLNTGPVTLTMDRAPDSSIVPSSTLLVYPRFPISGAMLNGKNIQTLPDTTVNYDPLLATLKDDTALVMLGTNADTYSVSGKTKFNLSTPNSFVPDVVRIHNAPSEQPLIFATVITANTKNFSIPSSGIGFWAQHGRVLKLNVGADTYYLSIDSANGQDGINLLDPIPTSLFSDQRITYEIVEAFHLPFWSIVPTNLQKYRFFRPPALGEVLFVGSVGQHDQSLAHKFTDLSTNFSELLKSLDLAPSDLLLYIDDGPEASTDPFVITNLTSSTLIIDGSLSTTAAGLSYHIVRRNNAWNSEFWINGIIQSGRKTIALSVPDGWDIIRNGTYGERVWDIISHPSGDPSLGNWNIPGVTGSYNPSTKLLTLDLASGQFTPESPIPDTNGFASALASAPCRVMPRLVDRAAAHGLSGSVIETFNYYLRDFFTLPLIRIQSVQLLNAQTLQSIRTLDYTLQVNDVGLRYSDIENNTLVISASDLTDAASQPLRISYLADLSIGAIDAYLQQPDTVVVNANQLAKRMETISIDLSVQVRTQLDVTDLAQKIAAFINTSVSTIPLSKDKLIQYLYKNNFISYIDVGTIVMSGDYYQADGTITHFDTSVNQIFGSETACYLSRVINVSQLASEVQ